jgi:hypothetical protein
MDPRPGNKGTETEGNQPAESPTQTTRVRRAISQVRGSTSWVRSSEGYWPRCSTTALWPKLKALDRNEEGPGSLTGLRSSHL